MEAGLRVDVATGGTPATMARQRWLETGCAGERIATKSLRSDDLIAVEAGRLLEDVRIALDSNLDTAMTMVGRLTALLASKRPQDARSGPTRSGLAPWQKRKIQSYIEDRLEEPLPVKDLAKLVSLSAGYFCRAFKESFGEPPHAYILRTRIELARRLMLTTCDSLSQIALACGFVDQAHLCRCFRQATGTTPGAWRRSHATEPALATVTDRVHSGSHALRTNVVGGFCSL